MLNIGIEVLKCWKCLPERMITKGRFSLVCTPAYFKALSASNIINGFQSTGIYLFDFQCIYLFDVQIQFLKKLLVLAQYHFRKILGHVTIRKNWIMVLVCQNWCYNHLVPIFTLKILICLLLIHL